MLTTILAILLFILVIKILFSVGIGITKFLIGGLGLVALIFILPVSLALFVPLLVIGAIVSVLVFLLKLIF